jgi:uncharacterized membrane protein
LPARPEARPASRLSETDRDSSEDVQETLAKRAASLPKRVENAESKAEISPGEAEPNEQRGPVFEQLFGRTLPIWAGGLTLAITGILGVKWSIDAGILSEGVRVFLGILFGFGLIGGAFWMRSGSDSRIPQALSGAGVATLYGAVLSAHLLYDLVGSGTALGGMVAVTLLGGFLSLRFGAPSAVVALAGGLAAPALIGGEGNLPLLACYVAAVTGGAALLARRQERIWLALLALVGGGLWVLVLGFMMEGPLNAAFVVMLALFIGFGVPFLAGSTLSKPRTRPEPIGAAIAIAQCAGLVMMGGYGVVQWAGLGLATLGAIFLARGKEYAFLPIVAGAIAFIALLGWIEASYLEIVVVTALFAAMHAAHAVWKVKDQSSGVDAVRLLAIPVAAVLVLTFHDKSAEDMALGMIFLAGAVVLAGIIEWVRSRNIDISQENEIARFVTVIMASAGAMLAFDGYGIVTIVLALIAAGGIQASGWVRAGLFAIIVTFMYAAGQVWPWFEAGYASLAAFPFLADDLPQAGKTFLALIPLVLVCLFAARKLQDRGKVILVPLLGSAGMAMLIMVHFGWKSLFGIDSELAFVELGMMERAGWQLALGLGALGAWRFSRMASLVLGVLALVHFFLFSLILHNPLWDEQMVGPAPVANLVGLSFAIAFVLVYLARNFNLSPEVEHGRRIVQMFLIVTAAFMLLRQAFLGSVMTSDLVSQLEDILRSLVAIGIALGLLVYGMRTQVIDWRIGSLALMILAVGKVFVFDAAGLDGLARIASFAALGFALIGVGWLYARLLPERSETSALSA